MNPFQNNSVVEQMLQRLSGPVRKVRTMLFVRENGKERVVEDQRDETDIGQGGAIETTVSHEAHFHDCGHFAAGNLGGRCECGALVCEKCLTHCAHCGLPLCPKHQHRESQSNEILCPPCSREAKSKRRLRKGAGIVASFFVRKRRDDDAG